MKIPQVADFEKIKEVDNSVSKLSANIPKDMSKMKPKVIGYLTARQAITFSIGGVLGIAAYWFISKYIDKALATYVMLVIAAPAFWFGVYQKYGFYLEELLFYFWESQLHRPRIRPYENTMKGDPDIEDKQQRKDPEKKQNTDD